MADVSRSSGPAGACGGEVLAEAEYDWAATAPSTAVVETIASLEDVDPVALSTSQGTTLNDHIDPEALNQVVTGGSEADADLAFTLGRYRVRIAGSKVLVGEASIQAPGSD